MLAFAWVWVNGRESHRWSCSASWATTSLLVYWVHIELVYGRWFGFWKESLSVSGSGCFSVVLIAADDAAIGSADTRQSSLADLFRTSRAGPQQRFRRLTYRQASAVRFVRLDLKRCGFW